MKKVLFIASNYGLWAEELQGPWDAVRKSGHTCVLATYKGIPPLPIEISLDAELFDPAQKTKVNSREAIQRVRQILETGEWDHPIKVSDARMDDYDAVVMVGGPGAPLDISGNVHVHGILLQAYKSKKIIAAICYAVAALAFTRDPETKKSIIFGRHVACHPHAWDFDVDLGYKLSGATTNNPGTDLVTPGFVFPLQYMVQDVVGPAGKVEADAKTSRQHPCVVWDRPFLTALSIESSALFGRKLVEILAE